MGTRSLTHIKTDGKDSPTLCTIYCQCDGYLDGVGKQLATIIAARKLVNGFSDPAKETNGIGCLAALIIGALKKNECGDVYIYPADSSGCDEEYTYTVYVKNNTVRISVEGSDAVEGFDGTAQELLNLVAEESKQ